MVLVGQLIVTACAPVSSNVPVIELKEPVSEPASNGGRPLEPPQVAVLPEIAPKAPPTKLPAMELNEFIGLSPLQLVALLGGADLDRKEPTARVLQYSSGDNCVLQLFLYQSVSSGLFHVEHAEVLPRGAGSQAQSACVTALLLRANAG